MSLNLGMASLSSYAALESEFEVAEDLQLKQVLPETLHSGKHHRTEARVRNDGLFNDYQLTTSYGQFRIKTTTLLKIRIREVYAIAAMREIETGDTAVKAVKKSGTEALVGAKNLLMHPVRTVGSAASAVEQLYARTTGTVRRKASDAEDSAFNQLVGLTKTKGEIASQFGVNLYSRNPVLQQELDRLARAAYIGGLSVKVATSVASTFAPIMGSVLLGTSGAAQLLNKMINETPPAEMWLQNKNQLLAMGLGLDGDKIENFLNRAVFSPAMQTVIVAALESLDGVEGRALFIDLALKVSDQNRAKLITELAVMSAAHHKNIRPLKKFVPMAKLLSAVARTGEIVVLLPADYMIWNENNASVMNHMGSRNSGRNADKHLWILGQVSGKMRSQLLIRGWQVHTQAGRLLRSRES
ncbi:MAG: hypothetical protein GY726_09365 [Proteobacteria bacterium]|nr:hypothetical protein [Pseudomonadota bacterium]